MTKTKTETENANGARAGLLQVPGAELYYEVRGSGPLLLIAQSGEGDAGRSVDLVDRLAEDHTVVTYDRRGLSRSALPPGRGVTMEEHADDVHRLLAELTDEPAVMLGLSLGASIGLHLAVRHPGQLSVLVAHEPVTPRLLPAGERSRHERELREIQERYRRDGLLPALGEVARVLGIDPAAQDREPGLTPQPGLSERAADFDFFLTRDLTAIVEDTFDPAELPRPAGPAGAGAGPRIVPVTGRTTPRTVFDQRCAEELAALLGTQTAEFPGGHNGNLTHPAAWATRLREVLAEDPRRAEEVDGG
ncbi:alpha/beta fold hydrolase [Streptomyces bambusae]|uniref:Alpha/beta fold hydrolase n=1 Tax=Streptomyces bambusae TaxID=1550616 RepID=A0ABS6ZH27_9ACTN|nr:alpha/beta hydrolase [Streptomyces bambusae]MBW5485945.1 alpha/beta fold hydrolase [Streptomyces bambusae]